MKEVVVSFDDEIIFGEYLERLIDFCFQISDEIKLVENHGTRITYNEYKQAREEAEKYYDDKEYSPFEELNEDELIKCFRESGETEEKIQEYIEEFRIQNCPRLQYVYHDEEIQKIIHTEFQKFGLIKREITFSTHCTMSGSPAVVYTFEINKQLKNQFLKMEDIFSPVFVQENKYYIDDPAFYHDGRLIMNICSHERYGTMHLTQEEYEKFKDCRVPHIVTEDCWWLHEELDPCEYPHIIIDRRVELGGLLGPNYLINDLANWEDQVKLYKEYRTLPPMQYKTVETIVSILNEMYGLARFNSEVIENQIKANIINNQCLAKHLKSKREITVELYEIEYMGKKLFLGVEKNCGYLVVDSFLTLKMIEELRQKQKEEQRETMYYFKVFNFDSESEPNVYPEECYRLCDEISILRGLDEFEQRDIESVNYYDLVKRRINSREFIDKENEHER